MIFKNKTQGVCQSLEDFNCFSGNIHDAMADEVMTQKYYPVSIVLEYTRDMAYRDEKWDGYGHMVCYGLGHSSTYGKGGWRMTYINSLN